MHCHGSWFDPVTILLGIAVLIAIFVDFLLGRAGRARLHDKLLTLWSQFDDIQVPKLGISEASYCLQMFDRLLSPRLVSIRRLVASTILFCMFVAIYYISVEAYRFE